MFVEAYGDNALSETTCRDWFRRFNDDNFDLSDKKRENRPRKEKLSIAGSFGERYPIAKNACRAIGCFSNISMRLHAMGKVQKIGKMSAA